MAKEFFKNLPSQETPFNASRWNGLLNGEESMGSIVVEDVTCKNLCPGVSQGYYLTTAGTSFGRTTTDNGLVIKVEENTDYTISTTDTQARYRIAFTNTLLSIGGSSSDVYNALTKDGTKENITRNSGTYKYLIVNATDLTKIQVEEGNKATDLTPYKKFGYNSTDSMGEIVVDDIKCKNDFPLLNNFNSAGIKITSNGDGTYNITGTATANVECVLFKNIEDTIIENGGTYTLSASQSLPTGVNSRIEFYNNTSYVRGFLTVINTASNNPTAAANTTGVNRVRFGLFVTSGTTVNITNLGLQLEKGSVATNYVEHKEFSNKETKSVSLWSGRVYESGSILTLRKPLEIGNIYIIEFYGLSGLYKSYETFIYTGNKYVQLNYYSSPDSTGFRYRLECEGNTITISNESVGNVNNSAITNIYEITSS